MTPHSAKPWIPPPGEAAWRALATALLHTAVPCQLEPDRWYSDDPATRQQAASACSTCPVISECREYSRAGAGNERFGIWAGVDRTPRPRTRPNDTDRSAP